MRAALANARFVGGAVPPTMPEKETVPEPPVSVRDWAPLRVLVKLILLLFEVMLLVPVKLTGTAKERGLAPDTVILLPI